MSVLDDQLKASIAKADAESASANQSAPATLVLTPSPAVTPDADAKPVTITLPARVHAYFKKLADEDDRTLNQFIARHLTRHHKDSTGS